MAEVLLLLTEHSRMYQVLVKWEARYPASDLVIQKGCIDKLKVKNKKTYFYMRARETHTTTIKFNQLLAEEIWCGFSLVFSDYLWQAIGWILKIILLYILTFDVRRFHVFTTAAIILSACGCRWQRWMFLEETKIIFLNTAVNAEQLLAKKTKHLMNYYLTFWLLYSNISFILFVLIICRETNFIHGLCFSFFDIW